MSSDTQVQLRAGAASVDITPEMGVQMTTAVVRPRPVERIVDRLWLSALVLESGDTRMCIVSADTCFITGVWADRIREQVAEQCGFDPDAIMLTATHTHSAPGVSNIITEDDSVVPEKLSWLFGDLSYNTFFCERVVEAIRLAEETLQDVQIGWASGIEGRVGFNRRCVMRDGTGEMLPRDMADALYVEGPIDPEVGVIGLQTAGGDMLAAMLHFSCHPTHGWAEEWVTSSWPGKWAEGFKELIGDSCTPLVLNGCSGNIHQVNKLDPTHDSDYHTMAKHLMETTEAAMPNINYSNPQEFGYRFRTVEIPYRTITDAELADAQAMIAEFPEGTDDLAVMWDWVYALSRVDMHRQMQTRQTWPCQVQVFRIGEIALVALPGECFVEGQLEIKLNSPTRPTFVASLGNGYVGYVPTPEALERGGYETHVCNWSKLAPEALDTLVDASLEMLAELF